MVKNPIISLMITAAAAFTAWAWTPSGYTAVGYHGQLSGGDGKILNQHGEPVILRGMSLYWDCWTPEFYSENAVKELAHEWKATVVRAAMSGSGNEPDCSGGGNESNITKVVDAAEKYGIYAIIDWHSHSAHNGANGESGKALAFFSRMAQKYKGKEHVIYEIYNEPCPTTQEDAVIGKSQCGGNSWAAMKGYMQAAVDTIRKHDSKNMILIGTPTYSQDVNIAATSQNAIRGEHLAYVVHFYAAQEGHKGSLRSKATAAINRGYPIFISEFGTMMANGTGAHDYEETQEWFNTSDDNFIGWANWSFSNHGGTSGAVSNSTSFTRQNAGPWIYDKLNDYAKEITVTAAASSGEGNVVITTSTPKLNAVNGKYYLGQTLRVSAEADPGWTFDGWGPTGAITGHRTNPVNLRLNTTANITINAKFIKGGLLKNGTFSIDIADWEVVNPGGAASRSWSSTNGGECKVGATNYGSTRGAVGLQQSGVALTKGRKYRLSFDARAASGTRQIVPTLWRQMTVFNRDTVAVTLESTMKTFTSEFDMRDNTLTNANMTFYYGGETGEWFIDNIMLEDIGPADGAEQCDSNPCATTNKCPDAGECDPCATNPNAPGCNDCVDTSCPTFCDEHPNDDACKGAITNRRHAAKSASWSLVSSGGSVVLRGPVEAGSRVTLYDVRGKVVRTSGARNGMNISQNLPAGNYFAVVRNAAGKEVFKARVPMVR